MSLKNIAGKVGTFFKPDAPQVVIIVASLVIAGLAYFSMTAEQTHNLRIQYDAKKSKLAADDSEVSTEDIRLGETDPTIKYAERQREASSIGLGLSLYIARQKISNGRDFKELPELISEFARSDIFPPQLKLIQSQNNVPYAIIASTRGLYYIRYQFAPLKLEILACGENGLRDGAVFVLRLPETAAATSQKPADSADLTNGKSSPAGKWATLFVSPSEGNSYLPPAFADAQIYLNSGWTIEPLRATEFAPDKVKQLQQFLGSVK